MILASATSVQSGAVNSLFLWVLVICMVIFLFVAVGVWLSCLRFTVKPGNDPKEPKQVHGNLKLELIWTIIPCLILVVLGVFTVQGISSILPGKGDQRPDVVVTGHQWWWSIEYPGHGVITANELVIPIGRNSLIGLESADVIHSFWVPQLSPKQDMVPVHPAHLWIDPLKTGTYTAFCAEFCGTQHANMRLQVRVVTMPEFEAWIAERKKEAAPPAAADAILGQQRFEALACSSCHRIGGTPAAGTAGPDLTHVASRTWLAAGAAVLDAESMADWLRDPNSIKPSSHMPNFHLSEPDLKALTSYLMTLK